MRVSELKLEMDGRFVEVQQQFAEVQQRFAEVQQQFAGVRQQFADVRQQFAEVRQQFAEMDRRITEEGEQTRRHFDVVAEQLKSEIALLATAVVRLERSNVDIRAGQATVFSALSDHELRLRILERPEPAS